MTMKYIVYEYIVTIYSVLNNNKTLLLKELIKTLFMVFEKFFFVESFVMKGEYNVSNSDYSTVVPTVSAKAQV